jgi:hypothetical protein
MAVHSLTTQITFALLDEQHANNGKSICNIFYVARVHVVFDLRLTGTNYECVYENFTLSLLSRARQTSGRPSNLHYLIHAAPCTITSHAPWMHGISTTLLESKMPTVPPARSWFSAL